MIKKDAYSKSGFRGTLSQPACGMTRGTPRVTAMPFPFENWWGSLPEEKPTLTTVLFRDKEQPMKRKTYFSTHSECLRRNNPRCFIRGPKAAGGATTSPLGWKYLPVLFVRLFFFFFLMSVSLIPFVRRCIWMGKIWKPELNTQEQVTSHFLHSWTH